MQHWPLKIWRFYADGFRNMTVGRKLWALIIIKVFVLFAILKLFFFHDTIEQQAGQMDKADFVRTEILNR